MARARKTQLYKNPKTGRWRLYARPATETSYLGGLTLPGLTKRPHMGPFNRVTDYKISDADEVYRKHDIGYGKEIAAGRSPYTRWNKYDQELMDAAALGWPDYLAKAVFGAKRFATYGLPYTKNTTLKRVYGKEGYPKNQYKWEPTGYDDFVMNEQNAPFKYEGTGTDPDVIALQEQQAAERWANKGSAWTDYTPENFPGGGGQGVGKSKLQVKSYISYE